MADLKTTYMGLNLENPIIVGSSGLTGDVEKIIRCQEAGAGAIVLKSLFEEVIAIESNNLERELLFSDRPEIYEYIRSELGMQVGPKPYLKFVEEVRKRTKIPVIASVNCVSPKWWVSYVKELESSGAHGIELNISHFSTEEDSGEIEERYVEIVNGVISKVLIPVAVKIGFYFTSIPSILAKIDSAGAKGIVLFNRYYTVDVDVKKKKIVPSISFSSPQEMLVPLRWIGIMSGKLKCDLAGSTGIHDADSVMKMIMVGARAVEICSVLYKKGPEYITVMKNDLSNRMDSMGINNIEELRGMALKDQEDRDNLLHRLQYMKALGKAVS